jgi:hypothetical protein
MRTSFLGSNDKSAPLCWGAFRHELPSALLLSIGFLIEGLEAPSLCAKLFALNS